jgi:hypothetical protein
MGAMTLRTDLKIGSMSNVSFYTGQDEESPDIEFKIWVNFEISHVHFYTGRKIPGY